ncbi:MAG: OmpA family protein [Bacteroidota bacterium]
MIFFTSSIRRISALVFLMLANAFFLNAQKITFTAKPRNVVEGDTVSLRWNVSNAKRLKNVAISTNSKTIDVADSLPARGIIRIVPNKSATYRLIAQTKHKTTRKTVRVNVNKSGVKYFILPDTVVESSPVMAEWFVHSAVGVTLNNTTDTLPSIGQFSFIADSTKDIVLYAWNRNGVAVTATRRLVVKELEYLTGDSVICAGQEARIEWAFRKAKQIQSDNLTTPISLAGSRNVKPDKLTVYKMKVEYTDGTVKSYQHPVTVFPAGYFSIQCPPQARRNETVEIRWDFKGQDSVFFYPKFRKVPAQGKASIQVEDDTIIRFRFGYKGQLYNVSRKISVVEREFVQGVKPLSEVVQKDKFSFEIFGVDRSHYPDSIKLYVMVVDQKGNYIRDITSSGGTRKYFRQLIENVENTPYPVNNFKVREITKNTDKYDISFVLDYSGSMSSDIKSLERSVKKVIDTKFPNDRYSFTRFDHRIVNLSGLTDNKNDLTKLVTMKGIDTMGGSTALYAGSWEGLVNLNGSENKKMTIVFSDGYENSSYLYYGIKGCTARDVVTQARTNDIRMNFISFRGGTNFRLLDFMGWVTDGNHYNIRNSKHIEKVLDEIIRVSHYYYEITYTPKNADGIREVDLVYFNNQEEDKANRKLLIGEVYDIESVEASGDEVFPVKNITDTIKKLTNMVPISPPQVVALFDFDKDDVRPEYDKNVELYAQMLKRNPNCKAILAGHSDLKGSTRYCLKISEKRANSVKNMLIKKGISASRIRVMGFGKSSPVWPEEKQEFMARENRRVEIIIVK